MAVMTNTELVKKLKDVANNYKTLYVMGCIGAPLTEPNKTRYINHHSYNQQDARKKMIQKATADTFGFDCVCLIKSILWGWNGSTNKIYGGATYASNGVPDINADAMIAACSGVTTDFSKIEVGEAVWTNGHIGVYIGDGLAVECTPAWKNKVQITACNCDKSGYNRRNWKKHGRLPYIEYKVEVKPAAKPAEIKVGDKVKINAGAYYTTGVKVPSKYTGNPYTVMQKQTGKSLIKELYSWVEDKYLTKASSSTAAPAASTTAYYQKYTGTSYQVDAVFAAIGVPEQYRGNWSKRKAVAKANGITLYIGSASQNTKLINLAKEGKLKKA